LLDDQGLSAPRGGKQGINQSKTNFPNPAYRKEAGFFVFVSFIDRSVCQAQKRKSNRQPKANKPELMQEITELARRAFSAVQRGWRMRQPDFPKLYSLRASEEVCPKPFDQLRLPQFGLARSDRRRQTPKQPP
jgi:hypothetical protein